MSRYFVKHPVILLKSGDIECHVPMQNAIYSAQSFSDESMQLLGYSASELRRSIMFKHSI